MADLRKAELSDFFKPKQPDADVLSARGYFSTWLESPALV